MKNNPYRFLLTPLDQSCIIRRICFPGIKWHKGMKS